MATTRAKNSMESFLTPLAAHIPISPNLLTLLAVLVMAIGAWMVLRNNLVFAAALILVSGFIDMLDGTVAKAQRKATILGAFLDRVGDRASDALIFGSIIFAGFVQLWLGLVVLVFVLLGSYISACLEAATRTHVGEALSMRAVRLVLLVVGLLLAAFSSSLLYIEYIFAVIGIITLAAMVQRMSAAYRLLR